MLDDQPTHEDPETPLATDGEGDIDDDRQDPPGPPKAGSGDGELDPTKATPGDGPEDQD